MKQSAFSLCELLITLGLAAMLLASVVEGICWVRKIQVLNSTAARDLIRARYFLRVECPDIVRSKLEAGESLKELFFVLGSQGRREISKEQFYFGERLLQDATLVAWIAMDPPKEDDGLFSLRLQFESPAHLQQAKRRTFELQTIVPAYSFTGGTSL